MTSTPSVAAVVVTYNRADMLDGMLDALSGMSTLPDAVYVVNNASTDHTREVLDKWGEHQTLSVRAVHMDDNTGGAGGFHAGLVAAYEAAENYDAFWLLDDDVYPAPDCLAALTGHGGPALMNVREDSHGELMELSATRFDLSSPFVANPKRASVKSTYGTRDNMPASVVIENVTFEGFYVTRHIVDTVGFPDPSFFIFYDDVDYALRIRRAGFTIEAVRDAKMVRRLDFNQQHDMYGWKGFYMFRNLYVVLFRYGSNAVVRAKPFAFTPAAALLALAKGHPAHVGVVVKALVSAWGMRNIPRR